MFGNKDKMETESGKMRVKVEYELTASFVKEMASTGFDIWDEIERRMNPTKPNLEVVEKQGTG